MGAELLGHQGSTAYYGSHHSRFMWGLLHFLDFDRHRHKRKMLPHKRNADEDDGGGTKILTSEPSDVSNFQKENETAAKKRSGGTHLITLLYTKLMKKKDRKSKDSSSAVRLLRTFSIHHLECDDYVLRDEMTCDSGSSTVEQDSHGTGLSASSEGASGTENSVLASPSVPHAAGKSLHDLDDGKMVLNRFADIEQKIESIIKEEHRISMDGVLDKIPFGHKLPDDGMEKEKVSSRGDSPRSKFGSEGFVSANSKLARRSIQRSRSLTESLEMYSSLEPQRLPQWLNSVMEQDGNSAHRRFLRSRSLSESLDKYSHLLEFISVRGPPRLHQRSTSVSEQENKFAHGKARKSRSLSESFDRYHLLESISVKEHKRLSQRSNSAKEKDNSFAHGRVLRSRSLSDSFDRYHLLESISVKEPQRLIQRSSSVQEQDGSCAHTRVVRTRSLSGYFDRYPNLLEPFSVREPKRKPERLKSIREEGSDMKSQIDSGFSNPQAGSSNDVPGEASAGSPNSIDSIFVADNAEVDACTPNEPNSAGILVKTEESMETDTLVQHDAGISSSLEQPEFTNEHDQSKACMVSDDQDTDDSSALTEDNGETESSKDASDETQKPSTVSVLDAIGPAKYAESQGIELQSGWIHSKEQDSAVNPENRLVDDDSGITQVEINRAGPDEERTTADTGVIDCFHAEDEAELNLVRTILKKSGFSAGAEEFLAAWSSSYDPVDQLLFVEEPETTTDDSSDIHLDHRLLFDLINEILLEIYESTIPNSIGLSRFNPRVGPVPEGDHLVEEVWAKVSWHLCSQQDTDHTMSMLRLETMERTMDG